jgi:hypothetical protein
MIVSRFWVNNDKKKEHNHKPVLIRGWFLFGIIPIYIKQEYTI